MAVWTVLFIELWKREIKRLQFEWDVIDFEKKMEQPRAEYELLKHLPKKKNPLTDVTKIIFTLYFFLALFAYTLNSSCMSRTCRGGSVWCVISLAFP